LAFNVLVGACAPKGQRVATRAFADVGSLRERGLVVENGDRFEIRFAPREGPAPVVMAYPHRNAEIEGAVETVRRLVREQKVLPSDILIVYQSHRSFGEKLAGKLRAVIGPQWQLRLIDNEHNENKNFPVVEKGVMTLSTIASAKGYDAPIVLLMGTDEIATDTIGRANFYVAATRAKFQLFVSGVKLTASSLLNEVLTTAHGK
jgi:superfamily I DNA and RNA helicase